MNRLLPFALVAATLSAHSTAAETIADTTWAPITLSETPFEPAGETFIQFGADGSYFGKDGCNSIRGRYVTNGDAILLGPAAATMMACPEPIMSEARAVVEALMAARSYAINNGELLLSDVNSTAIIGFAKSTAD